VSAGDARTRVITLACRTSDRLLDGTRGAVAVAPLLAEHLGIPTHTIGSASAPKVQEWGADLDESRGCLLEAGGQLEDALGEGLAPVLLAAECSVALSTLPTIARLRPDARFLWLDAHGDYNTPETSPSGYLGGMPLAGACGEWDADLDVGFIDPARVVHGGSRELDDAERALLEASGATLVEGRAILDDALIDALGDDPLYVHVDLDVLTAGELPVQFPTHGGLEIAELRTLLAGVAEGREVIGFEVTNFQAPIDEFERMLGATAVKRVVEPLLDALQEGAHVTG
jgi:arginase family enzyme